MVYTSPELPWLPQRLVDTILVDKILAGDYVGFNELCHQP